MQFSLLDLTVIFLKNDLVLLNTIFFGLPPHCRLLNFPSVTATSFLCLLSPPDLISYGKHKTAHSPYRYILMGKVGRTTLSQKDITKNKRSNTAYILDWGQRIGLIAPCAQHFLNIINPNLDNDIKRHDMCGKWIHWVVELVESQQWPK